MREPGISVRLDALGPAARHALLERAGWDVENDGLFGAPPLKVIAGDEVHVSVIKALGMLGLGRQRLRRVPVDGQGRILLDMLPPLWRRRAGQVRLSWAHFRDSAHLQPLEHEPCNGWCPAYLSADGLRILPASDVEGYREVIEELRQQAPQLLAQLEYDAPPGKPRRKRR